MLASAGLRMTQAANLLDCLESDQRRSEFAWQSFVLGTDLCLPNLLGEW